LEPAGSENEMDTEANLEKDSSGGSMKLRQNGARLRGWRAAESDGDASQVSYVPNGTKGHTTTTTTTTTSTTTKQIW
jgi:hypothetical protein